MAEIWQVILAIIAVIVIVIVVLMAFGFFRPLYAQLRGLGIDEEEQNKNNFDSLITNIGNCLAIDDNDCVCEGLPNYPGSFVVDSKLIITELAEHKAQINLTHGKKSYRSHTFSDLKISAVFYNTEDETPYKTKKEIDFSEEPPLFRQKDSRKGMLWWSKDMIVVSSFIYKKEDGIYFIVGYEKPKLTQFRKCGMNE